MISMTINEIPKPIIERIQMIIDFGTCGYTTLAEYIQEALIQDIEATLGTMGTSDKRAREIADEIREEIKK